MPRYFLTLEYHGAAFHGLQRQGDGLPTVQGVLEDALAILNTDAVTIHAAGRTDAGVHASGQCVHADLRKDHPPHRLCESLNALVRPWPLAVRRAAVVPDTLHARFDASERRYRYTVINHPAPSPLRAGQAWEVTKPLDVEAMRAATKHLIGRHDFSSFRATQCQAPSPVRTLDALEMTVVDDTIFFDTRAKSYLHHQVRNMVGTLVMVGKGVLHPTAIPDILAARDRRAAGMTAPAMGLCLTGVSYAHAV
ncbi:MAG: tRNA pseudouridine(38-40) synthase TruA [Holosporales bacterium]|jgi:tRNA pseudouridine38-40 synthase